MIKNLKIQKKTNIKIQESQETNSKTIGSHTKQAHAAVLERGAHYSVWCCHSSERLGDCAYILPTKPVGQANTQKLVSQPGNAEAACTHQAVIGNWKPPFWRPLEPSAGSATPNFRMRGLLKGGGAKASTSNSISWLQIPSLILLRHAKDHRFTGVHMENKDIHLS